MCALDDAHGKLKAARDAFEESRKHVSAWETLHPMPDYKNGRQLRKWERWQDKIYEQHGFNNAVDACQAAQDEYQRCQLAVAKHRPRNPIEMIAKASSSF